ncbi:TonB-linked outer membrane protein, SusC/RagA family [Arachidicoccus rhizosphaerae]|uniref:TonB-linked outer membrane protein, SusC/RagA family n=1 Tax=Arachidicoccus rhizosphaerae TaxID=551991 RepID=A0A1H4BD53_9BACT|nr:TonB-dependent receptor [Arachidicoccus rhizosphaerae]SEA46125.1 TonB-linked outer membrane protein, SusC/RagA family [Arachidicoccus rhizosphaerae]
MKRFNPTAMLLFLLTFCFAISLQAFGQSKTVSGKVTSEKGAPLPNASVELLGKNQGTTTDENGQYSIQAATGDVLQFSSVGYKKASFTVGNDPVINMQLTPTNSDLSDVIVVGYGTMQKKDLTGSVAVVDMNEVKDQPAASPVEAMQGKAAGVQIINDGSPGATPQIRIRGFSTINNNDPLFIIDGMPYTGKLSWLSAEDIESMQVLKDASAASIYGSRANNGVVIITTKKGKTGPPRISITSYYGIQSPNKGTFPDYMNPQQYADYLFAAVKNAGIAIDGKSVGTNYGTGDQPTLPEYLLAGSKTGQEVTAADADPSKYRYSQDASTFYQITKANQQGTNWFDVITHKAPMQSHEISILGGGENANYAISGGYFKQDGTIRYTGFERAQVRANSQFKTLNDHLTIGENMQYSRSKFNGFSTNTNTAGSYQGEGSPIGWAYRIQTIIPVYDIQGNFAGTKGSMLGNAENPLAVLYRAKDNINTDNQFFGSAYADLEILKGLNLKTTYGLRYDNYTNLSIGYPNPEFSEGNYTNNPLNESQGYATEWTWTNTLTYKHTFAEKNDLTLLAGTEAVNSTGRVLSGSGNSFFIFGDINYYYLDAASTNKSSGSSGYESSLYSLFARADYDYADKYLLSATIRRDGSSNFGPNHRYGNFPAASLAWRISNENFMKGADWINDLKLRVGYGATGNQSIPSFQYLTTFQASQNTSSYPVEGTSLASGIWSNSYSNPDVKWEELKSWNAGLDFTILDHSFDGSLDFYNRKTSDMLYPVPQPAQAVGGGSSPYVNIGSMTNKGVELGVNYHYHQNARKDEFKFDLGFNISKNINKLVELAPTVTEQIYGSFRSINTSILRAGEVFGAFYGYKVTGIYQSTEDIANTPSYDGARVGGQKYADINNDGVIDANDRTIIGNPHPDFIYSLSFNATWKRWDLSMFFNASQGNDIFDATRYYTDFSAFDGAVSTRLLNAWSPTNTGSHVPAPYRNPSAMELESNSYYIQDGSYFRMKNIQLGYTFPTENWFKNKEVKSLRAYISASNLFTITGYSGLDPEVSQFSSTFSAPGVDLGVYPASRQFIFGLNVTF